MENDKIFSLILKYLIKIETSNCLPKAQNCDNLKSMIFMSYGAKSECANIHVTGPMTLKNCPKLSKSYHSAQRRFRCTLQLCWICQMFEDRALSLMNPRHGLEIASAYQCFFHLVLCCIYFVGDIQHIGSWCSKHASPWPS